MDKYEKILREICYVIKTRKDYFYEICKERKTLENMHSKIIYNELYQMIEWLFENVKEEEKNVKPELVFDDYIRDLNELITELESLEEESELWIKNGFVKENHALKIVVKYLKEIKNDKQSSTK